jgi:hypothetical protein
MRFVARYGFDAQCLNGQLAVLGALSTVTMGST